MNYKESWNDVFDNITGESRIAYTLAGDYHCNLTTAELNEWGEFIRENPQYMSYIVTKYILDGNIATGSPAIQASTILLLNEIKKLNVIAKKWYEDLLLKRKAAHDEAKANKV